MENISKKYTNGEVTVIWKPKLCIHAGTCFTELPKVFIPYERPWVNMDGAPTEKIIETVKQCPSAALSYYMNAEKASGSETNKEPEVTVSILKNGPVIVKGNIKMLDVDGNEIVTEGTTALCRCGASKNKPFCDGSHVQINFEG